MYSAIASGRRPGICRRAFPRLSLATGRFGEAVGQLDIQGLRLPAAQEDTRGGSQVPDAPPCNRLHPQSSVVFSDSFGNLTRHLREGATQAHVGFRNFGVDAERSFVLCDGVRQTFRRSGEEMPEIIVPAARRSDCARWFHDRASRRRDTCGTGAPSTPRAQQQVRWRMEGSPI